jgi:hypothetical protein
MNYPAASYGVSKTSIRNRPFAASCGELTRMRLILYAIQVALSIKLIVVMELFLNRSVKNLHLAASVE